MFEVTIQYSDDTDGSTAIDTVEFDQVQEVKKVHEGDILRIVKHDASNSLFTCCSDGFIRVTPPNEYKHFNTSRQYDSPDLKYDL